MNWKTFASVFPVDTRRLLGILLPDLLVEVDMLKAAPRLSPPGKVSPFYTKGSYHFDGPKHMEVQTASVGPGMYHLRARIGEDWSPWMDPAALKLWLIIEHPGLFMVAV